MASSIWRRALVVATMGLSSASALAQTAEHVAAVKAAQERAVVRANATNGCAPASEDFAGWPASLVQRCEYRVGDMTGVAYVLDVKPETMAQWIETSCAEHMGDVAGCFDRVLSCAAEKSGLVFAVGGNVISNRKGALQNMFYRNGVAIGVPQSGKPGAIAIEEQEKLARLPEANVPAMSASGAASFWRTLPFQFAVKAIDLGVPAEMNTPDRRQKWLEILRAEMQLSLTRPLNRLLMGWMTAHPITLRTGECPDDRDP